MEGQQSFGLSSSQQKGIDDTSMQHELAFIIDIDGTLLISHKQTPGASDALNFLSSSKIPYLLLTNNISHSQQKLAEEINSLMKLNQPITEDKVILNYTPTKNIVDWSNIIVLMVGRQARFNQILPLKHIPKYVTIEEYCSIFPQLVPLGRRKLDQRAERIKKTVEQRLGIQNITKQRIQFGAIIIICCPVNWQQSTQVIMDILNSPDGSYPIHKTTYSFQSTHIPIMTTINDLLYMVGSCNLPRILIRPFNEMIQSTFKQIFKQNLEMKIFGKPNIETFKYTEKHCEKVFKGKIKKYVMVGDNPQVDIEGGYRAGWDTILFKSGVAKEDSQIAKINCVHLLNGIKDYLTNYAKQNSNLN